MTLNITVASARCIYQSADYQLLDMATRRPIEMAQKVVQVNAFRWTAIICFSGIGRVGEVEVGVWLADRMGMIGPEDDFDRVLDELVGADAWLELVPLEHRRHSFSVGAFVGNTPVLAVVSNHESLRAPARKDAAERLSISRIRPDRPFAFVSGQTQTITRPQRRRLLALVARDPDTRVVYDALAHMNREAAAQTEAVSQACYTAHVRLTGEGGGQAHGDEARLPVVFAIPEQYRDAISRLLDEQFGPGRARIVATSTMRMDASDEFHETQIGEKSDDPNAHSNYGAYLQDKKGDLDAAEREYEKAIALDPNHINALGNLANLNWRRGDEVRAEELYRRALGLEPDRESTVNNFANFLIRDDASSDEAFALVEAGIARTPNSGRLHILRGQIALARGDYRAALNAFTEARDRGVNPSLSAAGYAYSMHLSGASIGVCIGAYRSAIALNPDEGALRLNLAQLLFIQGETREAIQQLVQARRLGLSESAQLEAHVYALGHGEAGAAQTLENIKSLVARGARLVWDVTPNITVVRERDPERAALIEVVVQVMVGARSPLDLDGVAMQLAGSPSGRRHA